MGAHGNATSPLFTSLASHMRRRETTPREKIPEGAGHGVGCLRARHGGVPAGPVAFLRNFHAFDPGFAGTCAAVSIAGSSEDIQVDAQRGLAYLSVLDRASLARHEQVDGTVMLLDLNLAEPAPRAAMAYDPPGFRPHGLSVFTRGGEPARLFAISHRPDGSHAVEIAEQDANGAFVPKESVTDPAFVQPECRGGRRSTPVLCGERSRRPDGSCRSVAPPCGLRRWSTTTALRRISRPAD